MKAAGTACHIVREEEWSAFPKVAQALRDANAFTSIPEDVASELRITSAGVPAWGGHDGTMRTARAGPLRVITNGFVDGIVRPAVREGSYLRLLPDSPGEGTYYPQPLNRRPIKLRIGHRVQEFREGRWYYDPVDRNLVRLLSVTF